MAGSRRFRRDRRSRRSHGPAARAVRRPAVARGRIGLADRRDLFARMHAKAGRPAAGLATRARRGDSPRPHRSGLRQLPEVLPAPGRGREDRVRRLRSRRARRPAEGPAFSPVLRQPARMARWRSLAAGVPARAQRLPGERRQLQVRARGAAARTPRRDRRWALRLLHVDVRRFRHRQGRARRLLQQPRTAARHLHRLPRCDGASGGVAHHGRPRAGQGTPDVRASSGIPALET
jgi:hypothetical protein